MAKSGVDLLREAMEKRELGVNELGAQLGVAQGAVSHWLSGQRTPNLDSALAIERLLGIPVEAWETRT